MNVMRYPYPTQYPVHVSSWSMDRPAEMSRLINAALVDQEFCGLLLSNPSAALTRGYNGEMFSLSPTEKRFVLTVRAKSLNEFASRWVFRDTLGADQ